VSKDAKLDVVCKVDPEIIGGFIVEVGGKTVDLSVSSKVNKLNRLLSQAV
jgi:F-type H+-transporting ATPase subunit O